MNTFTLPDIPASLYWKIPPSDWKIESDKNLIITAGEKTDLFTDPDGSASIDNAPVALFTPPDENFVLSVKLKVEFSSTFDAGVIQIRCEDNYWAKLCLEYSPQQKPTIVTVVNREVSDDCNSVIINKPEVCLRVAVKSKTIAFFYSSDNHFWHLVRYFTLGKLQNLQVGFSSQSPMGKQCTVYFSEIIYSAKTLTDYRNGE